MVGTDQLDRTFAALADPTRRAILARLATGEASVTELAEPFEMSMPAVSKHLKVLERACEAIGRDPASIHRSAHVAVVRDEEELRERFGSYDYTVTDGAVAFGSDDQVLERIKTFEEAGADQILFAGAIREGTEQLERVAALMSI